jgi:hypothetical protein
MRFLGTKIPDIYVLKKTLKRYGVIKFNTAR